ncbi:hypothetical protein ACVWWN_000232 [Mycobacterium sp. URHB0021]
MTSGDRAALTNLHAAKQPVVTFNGYPPLEVFGSNPCNALLGLDPM